MESSPPQTFPVRISYQWKKPGAKTHHGYAMGVVQAKEKTPEGAVAALKEKHPTLQQYEIVVVRLEWR